LTAPQKYVTVPSETSEAMVAADRAVETVLDFCESILIKRSWKWKQTRKHVAFEEVEVEAIKKVNCLNIPGGTSY